MLLRRMVAGMLMISEILAEKIIAPEDLDERDKSDTDLFADEQTYTIYTDENSTITLRYGSLGGCQELDISSTNTYLTVYPNHIHTPGLSAVNVSVLCSVPYLYDLTINCTKDQIKIQHVLSVIVRKSPREEELAQIFGIVMNIFLASAMFIMGCELDFNLILDYLKKPLGPIIGICCQFLGMPLIAYALGYIFLSDRPFARLGFLILGSSPGGSASNFWTILFKGDMNMSVTMTFCSSLASFGMTSFWVYVLGSTIVTSDTVAVPYVQLVFSLLSLVVPLCLGMLLAAKKQKFAISIRRFSRPVFLFVILVSVVAGIYLQRKTFLLLSWREIVPAFLLGLSGYTIGCIAATLARLSREQIIAVSLETAIQNPAIGFVVMQSNLTSPYSEIGSLPIIAYLLVATGPPMITVLIIVKTIQFFRSKRAEKEELETLKTRPSPADISSVSSGRGGSTLASTDLNNSAADNPVPVNDNV